MIRKVMFWLALLVVCFHIFIIEWSVDHMFNGNEIIKIEPRVYLTSFQSLIFYSSLGVVAVIGLLMGLLLDANLAAFFALVNIIMWIAFRPIDTLGMAITEIMLTMGFMPMLVLGALAKRAAEHD